MAESTSKENKVSVEILVEGFPLHSFFLEEGKGIGNAFSREIVVPPPHSSYFSLRISSSSDETLCFRVQVSIFFLFFFFDSLFLKSVSFSFQLFLFPF